MNNLFSSVVNYGGNRTRTTSQSITQRNPANNFGISSRGITPRQRLNRVRFNMNDTINNERNKNTNRRHRSMRRFHNRREQQRLNNLFDFHRRNVGEDNLLHERNHIIGDNNHEIDNENDHHGDRENINLNQIVFRTRLNQQTRDIEERPEFEYDVELFRETTLTEDGMTINMNFPTEDGSPGLITTFHTENFNVRYNHPELLSPMDAEGIYQNIMFNLHQQNSILAPSDMSILDPGEYHNPGNDEDIIQCICDHMQDTIYGNVKSTLNNDTCPVCIEPFEDSHKISILTLCNHGICSEHKEQYSKLFKKCPLCNHKLY